jgi:hypothetical protein
MIESLPSFDFGRFQKVVAERNEKGRKDGDMECLALFSDSFVLFGQLVRELTEAKKECIQTDPCGVLSLS